MGLQRWGKDLHLCVHTCGVFSSTKGRVLGALRTRESACLRLLSISTVVCNTVKRVRRKSESCVMLACTMFGSPSISHDHKKADLLIAIATVDFTGVAALLAAEVRRCLYQVFETHCTLVTALQCLADASLYW